MKPSHIRAVVLTLSFLLITVLSLSAQTVYTVTETPGSAASVPFAGSSFDFVNSSNVDSNGRDYASATALATLLYGQSNYLEAKNFNFAIPSNATIVGIQANIDRDADGLDVLTSVTDDQVYLLRNGTITGNNQAKPAQWSGTEAIQTYGSPMGLWGTAWTPAQVNSPTFGLSMSVDLYGVASLIPTAKVYNIQLSVSYTLPVTVLPIHLDDFGIEAVDEGIKLDWLDDDVDAGTSYQLERSGDLNVWTIIDSDSYNGDHMDVMSFSYTDISPLPGRSYYRLNITAVDGTKTISDILLNDDGTSSQKPEGYPNPARDHITLTGISVTGFSVYSAYGMIENCPMSVVQGGLQVDISALPAGIYFARNGRNTIRFMKIQ